MFRKSLLTELRQTARVMLPLLIAVPGLALIAGVLLRITAQGTFGHKIAFLFEDAFLLTAMVVFLVTFVLMIVRFYKKLLARNAMLALADGCPGIAVAAQDSVPALVFPGMIASFIWYIGAFFSGLAGCALIDRITGSNDYLYFLGSLADMSGSGGFLLCCLESLICAFLFHASVALHFYGAMALGHRCKRGKILLCVGFYILMSMAASLVFALLMLLITGKCSAAPFSAWLDNQLSVPYGPDVALLPHKLFGLAAAVLGIRAGLFGLATAVGLKRDCGTGPRSSARSR